MSLLTFLGEIPLYTTIEEAKAWGSSFGITGYHTHIYNGVTGYMSGENHEDIDIIFNNLGISVDTSLEPSKINLSETQSEVLVTQTNLALDLPRIVEETIEETTEVDEIIEIEPRLATPIIEPTTPAPSRGGGY